MNYYQKKEKKISSLIAYLIIIIICLFSFSLISKQKQLVSIRASQKIQVQDLVVSNIFASSASISFFTKTNVKAIIKYGQKDNLNNLAFDVRDSKKTGEYKLHYFNLWQLEPNIEYSFKLIINDKELNNQTKNIFKTHPSLNENYVRGPIFGKVLNNNLAPEKEILVKFTLPDVNKDAYYTTLSKDTGEWIATLPYVYDLSQKAFQVTEETKLKLLFLKNGINNSTVNTYFKNANPLPSVILGKDYNYLEINNDGVLGSSSKKIAVKSSINISNPINNSILANQKPLFRGQAGPNIGLQVLISPINETGSITTDEFGDFRYWTQNLLAPGKYEFKLTNPVTKEKASILFFIGKSGEAVLGSATDSATITPISITETPTIIPTLTIIPTEDLAEEPVATIQPTITQIQQTGINNNLFILAASSLSLLGLFFILY